MFLHFSVFSHFFAIQINKTDLAEEVGGEDEGDHEEGDDEEDDLQPLVGLATELDRLEALTLETGSIVIMMVMMLIQRVVLLST